MGGWCRWLGGAASGAGAAGCTGVGRARAGPAGPRPSRAGRVGCVTRVYTDVAVFLIRAQGVLVRETHGLSFEELMAIVPMRLARA